MYTLIVGPLTDSVAGAIGHALYPAVPSSLDVYEYMPFQQHMRPLELLILAGVMWWSLNWSSKSPEMTRLSGASGETEIDSRWEMLGKMFLMVVVPTVYLLILIMMLWLLEPEGPAWTLATAGTGLGIGTAAFMLVRRAGKSGFTMLFAKKE